MTDPTTMGDRPHPKEMERMYSALSEFYEPKDVERWLKIPNKLLGNATPLARISQGREQEVWAVIASLQDGAFV